MHNVYVIFFLLDISNKKHLGSLNTSPLNIVDPLSQIIMLHFKTQFQSFHSKEVKIIKINK